METERLKKFLSYGVVDRYGRPLAPGDCVEYWRDLGPGDEESVRPDVVLGFIRDNGGNLCVVSGYLVGGCLQLIRMSAPSLVKVRTLSPEYARGIVAAALAEKTEGRQWCDRLIGFNDLKPLPLSNVVHDGVLK